MKIYRIGYTHSFQVSQFMYDKIYLEAELEPGDTEEQVTQTLIEKCKEVAAKVQGVGFQIMNMQTGEVSVAQQPFSTLVTIHKDNIPKQSLEDEIKNAKDLENLKSCHFLIRTEKSKDKRDQLTALYDKRAKELSNQ